MPATATDLAVSISYLVEIDSWSLGYFTGCSGLGAEVVIETREEGGNNELVWQLPTRLRYPNITLTRPIGADSPKLGALFSRIVTEGYQPGTGTIVAMDSTTREIARWGLLGIVPVRWSGPQMSPDSMTVVEETLEIAHHGFVTPGAS
ncbi:MAG: phage tail protein [Promicromonosporaceae bacterium]|nr:phage tail protein [Promicromonosporaceae bacterium]